MSTVSVSLGEVAASLALVAVAVAVSFWRRAELEQDIAVAVLRSFLQLTAVGYVIQAIFDTDSLWLVVALLAGMVLFGTWTARGRARHVPGVAAPILLAPRRGRSGHARRWSSYSGCSRPSRATWFPWAGW